MSIFVLGERSVVVGVFVDVVAATDAALAMSCCSGSCSIVFVAIVRGAVRRLSVPRQSDTRPINRSPVFVHRGHVVLAATALPVISAGSQDCLPLLRPTPPPPTSCTC